MTESFSALTVTSGDNGFERGVREVSIDELPPDGTLVDVEWSSVNFKDALAASANGRVARISPLVAGIDLSGTVRQSDVDWHGYDLGVARHGGFSGLARVPSDWIVPLPTGLSLREAMVIGTAGYTAALSVLALLDHGVAPAQGSVLVTGATGGVGSMAVSMLAQLGFTVVASTGKTEAEAYLREIGASAVVPRQEITAVTKPLLPMKWSGAVDCVGGVTLAHVLAQLAAGGVAAVSGNVGGADLPTTVLPFILRGITLCGIDSVTTPIERRRSVWDRLGADLKPPHLDAIEKVVELAGLEAVLDQIARGEVVGRYVVDLRS
jgi:acrylyl-CoA reductase (NADPH)